MERWLSGRRSRLRNFLMVLSAVSLAGFFTFASAQTTTTCGAATSAGANNNQANWQSVCWVDFASLDTNTIRTAAGQNFVVNLADGSQLSFTVTSPTTSAPWTSATAPSWAGAAIGTSSYNGIPGQPIIRYTANKQLA